MNPKQGLAFVKRHGVVLQAARGPAVSLAEAIAGGPIRGSWWGHPKGHEIFRVAEAVTESPDVLVCKLIDGKVTYVHRRLWPALVRLSSRFGKAELAQVWNEHTASGAHRSRSVPFPQWVPAEVQRQAARLSVAEAERLLSPWAGAGERPAGGRSGRLSVTVARAADAAAIAALRTACAQDLTARHGRGHWSSCPTEEGVVRWLETSHVLVARRGRRVVGTVRIEAKKPWAIDVSYFTKVAKAVYLHDLAVAPAEQGRAVGRSLVAKATVVAREWPSQAVRLDAYEHPAGAGPFYAKCGFREVGRVTYRGVPLVYFELLL